MRYRRFGKTNLQVSVLSLGTMRCLASGNTAGQTIKAAVDQGINHLETAQGYGKSEIFLGQALRALELPRAQVYITTKIPPLPTAPAMAAAIERSLERLGLDYIDCLAIHGLNTPQHLAWVQAPEGCMAAVRQAIARGQIRYVGFSTHGSLELIQAAIATNWFAFVSLHYYYFFQRHAPAIAQAAAKDMGILIISPSDKGGKLYTPPPKLQNLSQPLTPLELNYRFLLGDPRITTLSVGPSHPDELTEPLAIADRGTSLTDEEQAALARWEQQRGIALGEEQCQQCYACLPCPENIHIPEVLRLRNLAIAYDMTAYGQYRYGMFENAGHWFPGVKANRCTDCGDCLPRCPSQLNIPSLLRDTHERLQGSQGRRLWDC